MMFIDPPLTLRRTQRVGRRRHREWLLHTFRVSILYGAQATPSYYAKLHRSSVNERPTAVELVIRRPQGFDFDAGQWVHLRVPEIDGVWHAFSIASCPADEAIHLHIGVRGDESNWVDPQSSGSAIEGGKEEEGRGDDVKGPTQRVPTWTYKLFAMIRERVASMFGLFLFQCCVLVDCSSSLSDTCA